MAIIHQKTDFFPKENFSKLFDDQSIFGNYIYRPVYNICVCIFKHTIDYQKYRIKDFIEVPYAVMHYAVCTCK